MKSATIVIGIILILGAVTSLLMAAQADSYLKRAVEAALSVAAGAPVTIDRLHIMPLRQSIEVSGLAIQNPPGFKSDPAMTVESVLIHFDAKSLFSEQPRVNHADVRGATVNLRYDTASGWNLTQLAKQTADTTETARHARTIGRRFHIESVHCNDVKVCLVGGLLPGRMVNLDLAPFTLKNIEKPVTIAESTAIFLRSALTETLTLKGLLKPLQTEIQQWLEN